MTRLVNDEKFERIYKVTWIAANLTSMHCVESSNQSVRIYLIGSNSDFRSSLDSLCGVTPVYKFDLILSVIVQPTTFLLIFRLKKATITYIIPKQYKIIPL